MIPSTAYVWGAGLMTSKALCGVILLLCDLRANNAYNNIYEESAVKREKHFQILVCLPET